MILPSMFALLVVFYPASTHGTPIHLTGPNTAKGVIVNSDGESSFLLFGGVDRPGDFSGASTDNKKTVKERDAPLSATDSDTGDSTAELLRMIALRDADMVRNSDSSIVNSDTRFLKKLSGNKLVDNGVGAWNRRREFIPDVSTFISGSGFLTGEDDSVSVLHSRIRSGINAGSRANQYRNKFLLMNTRADDKTGERHEEEDIQQNGHNKQHEASSSSEELVSGPRIPDSDLSTLPGESKRLPTTGAVGTRKENHSRSSTETSDDENDDQDNVEIQRNGSTRRLLENRSIVNSRNNPGVDKTSAGRTKLHHKFRRLRVCFSFSLQNAFFDMCRVFRSV